MIEQPEEVPFQLLTLLRRISGVSDEWGVSVETSLYRSNVTGSYVLEQVQQGRHETTTNSISLVPATIAELLPILRAIVEADEPEREEP